VRSVGAGRGGRVRGSRRELVLADRPVGPSIISLPRARGHVKSGKVLRSVRKVERATTRPGGFVESGSTDTFLTIGTSFTGQRASGMRPRQLASLGADGPSEAWVRFLKAPEVGPWLRSARMARPRNWVRFVDGPFRIGQGVGSVRRNAWDRGIGSVSVRVRTLGPFGASRRVEESGPFRVALGVGSVRQERPVATNRVRSGSRRDRWLRSGGSPRGRWRRAGDGSELCVHSELPKSHPKGS
jgi:hypothetical protein